MILGEDRDEGRGHRSLREELSEKIRNTIGDEERIGGRRGAEKTGEDHIADEAEYAARKRRGADQPGGFGNGMMVIRRLTGKIAHYIGIRHRRGF